MFVSADIAGMRAFYNKMKNWFWRYRHLCTINIKQPSMTTMLFITNREVFMIEPLLNVEDIMRMFHVSRVTVYRWISLARRNQSRFPLPVGGHKQKLCWNRADVERFCLTQPAAPLTKKGD